MKISLTYFYALAAALCAVAVEASMVAISNIPVENYFTDSSGYRLADGSLVWLGAFGNPSAIESGMSVEALQAAAQWQWFGSTSTISIGSESGKLGDDVVNDTQAEPSFSGRTIYIWVFNQPTLGGATEYGIFTARGGDDPWVFAPDGVGSTSTIRLDNDALEALVGSKVGTRLMLSGIIPEPATYAALLGVAALAGVAIRRHRK